MKHKKITVLREISDQFNHGVNETLAYIKYENVSISKSLEENKELQELYSIVEEKYPTWPFSTRAMRRISISAALPIVISIASLVIDYLL